MICPPAKNAGFSKLNPSVNTFSFDCLYVKVLPAETNFLNFELIGGDIAVASIATLV